MIKRVRQVVWMTEYPRDLAADFRAIYHLAPREVRDLDGPEYLALASRLPMYPGVLAARVEQEERSERKNLRNHPDAKLVPSTREAIMADPQLRDLVEM